MVALWNAFWNDESGQDLAEYALLIALIALVVIAAVTHQHRQCSDWCCWRVVVTTTLHRGAGVRSTGERAPAFLVLRNSRSPRVGPRPMAPFRS
jgi:Flp pilus assembly pilin Flp